jgi:diaminohydroxyphosphoribosylaminopyrimidine deaminase/5-amino-6-(5-phosphoribosylamino)uracil reductase
LKTPFTAEQAMRLAIAEAQKGLGFVSPNPPVGCVILDRNMQLLCVGYHAQVGKAHAEAHALSQISDIQLLEGAHVFVTLEPCAHQGRTPSCAKALARLPLASVTYGLIDPNPQVRGQGAQILRDAGIQTEVYPGLQRELNELCEIFLCNIRNDRPFVALKAATTLDGKMAMSDGTSQWITESGSRSHVQFLRGCYDCVVVGADTVLKDNPRLNSRDPRFAKKESRVVILDHEGKLQKKWSGLSLLKVRAPEDVVWVTGAAVSVDIPVRNLVGRTGQNAQFNLQELLKSLRELNIHSLFVEGGPRTFGTFLTQRLADRLYLFLAPKILGDGLSWPIGHSSESLDKALRLESMQTTAFGQDLMITGQVSLTQPNL